MGLLKDYRKLLKELGPQGWWPVTHKGRLSYHPGDYSFPRTGEQAWEICMGAVLTQNTSWKNVEKALESLNTAGILCAEDVLKLDGKKLARLIRSSGYYNQKALKLKELARAVGPGVKQFLKHVSREELLQIRGIGPETADSILLYAGKRLFFVVDSYTRRLFSFPKDAGYEEIRREFERQLPRDRKIYNEFHALIVEKCKRLREPEPQESCNPSEGKKLLPGLMLC